MFKSNFTNQGLGSIEIIGLEGTNASLLGGKSFNYINFPGIINIPSIQYGTYTLRAKKQGFMVINEEIEFRDTYMSIDLFDYYQPKSKKSAISRSLLIPGGGQLYLDRKRGFLYLFGEAMFLGLSVYYHQEYKNREHITELHYRLIEMQQQISSPYTKKFLGILINKI